MRKYVWILLFVLIGCDTPHWSYSEIPGKVTQVRILQSNETVVRDNDHPVAGAIVGGMVAGMKGAIVGALVGSGSVTTTVVTELEACELSVQTEDGKMHRFWLGRYSSEIKKCAMSQPGDPVYLQLHVLKDSAMVREQFFSWECRWTDGSCSVRTEEVRP